MKVREWMTAEPVTVTAATTVGRARDLLESRGVRHLPVIDAHGHVVGIVSNRDVAITDAMLRAAVRQHDVPALLDDDRNVEAVMSSAPQTIGMDAPIEDAARVFASRHISALPVVDDERHLIGILTTTDCLLAVLHDAGRPSPEPQ